jgi:hypothetical protein
MTKDDASDFEPIRGEHYLVAMAREHEALEIAETARRHAELSKVIEHTRRTKPDHPKLARADATLAEFKLQMLLFLAGWSPTNGFRGYEDLAGH